MCVATIELDELLMYKSPLLLPLFSVVFQKIYVKKVGGWCNSPRKTVRWHVSPLPGPLVDMLLSMQESTANGQRNGMLSQ